MREVLSEAEIEAAWRKARPLTGQDPRLYRIAPDVIQSVIRRDRYGICGEMGWCVEHGRPVSFRDQSMETAMKLVQEEIFQEPVRIASTGRSGRRQG